MKPFNLERALVGDKVVTRDGREVTQLTRFDCRLDCLAGVVDGDLETWREGGKYWGEKSDSNFDLFMAPKTVKRWVNFYADFSYSYRDEHSARYNATSDAIAIAVPVEFEEGFNCGVQP